jgi:hypothetical protein
MDTDTDADMDGTGSTDADMEGVRDADADADTDMDADTDRTGSTDADTDVDADRIMDGTGETGVAGDSPNTDADANTNTNTNATGTVHGARGQVMHGGEQMIVRTIVETWMVQGTMVADPLCSAPTIGDAVVQAQAFGPAAWQWSVTCADGRNLRCAGSPQDRPGPSLFGNTFINARCAADVVP